MNLFKIRKRKNNEGFLKKSETITIHHMNFATDQIWSMITGSIGETRTRQSPRFEKPALGMVTLVMEQGRKLTFFCRPSSSFNEYSHPVSHSSGDTVAVCFKSWPSRVNTGCGFSSIT